jgi:hypothetical protein
MTASRRLNREEILEARIALAANHLALIEECYQALDSSDDRRRANAQFAGFSSAKAMEVACVLKGDRDFMFDRDLSQLEA